MERECHAVTELFNNRFDVHAEDVIEISGRVTCGFISATRNCVLPMLAAESERQDGRAFLIIGIDLYKVQVL